MKTFVRANWDRVAAVVLVLLGGLALLLGWIGVSGTGIAAEQNPYLISGGVVGIALIAIGCTVWLSSDLQDEWRRLDALEERLSELVSDGSAAAPEANAANGEFLLDPTPATPGRGVVRRGGRRTTASAAAGSPVGS